jgi:hypothetical protein
MWSSLSGDKTVLTALKRHPERGDRREIFDRGGPGGSMTDFDGLDLQSVEDQLEEDEGGEGGPRRVVLGILDGTTSPGDWIGTVESGAVLVLDIEGDLNELAAGFARDIREGGGELMHFRGFLVVSPPGVHIDADRLG